MLNYIKIMDRLELLEIVRENGMSLGAVDEIYKNDKEIVLTAIK